MDLLKTIMDAYIENSYKLTLEERSNTGNKANTEELNASLELAKKAVTDVHRKGFMACNQRR